MRENHKNLENTRKRIKIAHPNPSTLPRPRVCNLGFVFFGFLEVFCFFLEEMLKSLRILPKKRYAHDLFTNKMSLRLLSTHPCCTFGSIRLFALNNLVLNFLDIQMICCKIRKTAPGADILKTRKDVLQRMMTAIGERRGEGATVRETSQKKEVELWVGFPYGILKYTYPGPECS